ncbi:DNA-directed RNA polymerase III subunit [Vairimorpha necatrix]|uniref:DNA-directed RNA polymerase III subunit n=1 Tax=Vairimorpha necatrix TaxID=6039 RepID=A0AAX4JDF6_9MICR
MFVESKLEDSLKIYFSSKTDKSIQNILTLKYRNKFVPEVGLGIFIKNNYQILEKKCVEDYILYKIHFNIIFYRFLRDEILEGTVFLQNETGLFISIFFYDKIYVPIENLPDNSEITYIYDEKKNKKLSWVWNYKNNRFFIKTGEKIKFKVIKYDEENKIMLASLNESGLGPLTWWE